MGKLSAHRFGRDSGFRVVIRTRVAIPTTYETRAVPGTSHGQARVLAAYRSGQARRGVALTPRASGRRLAHCFLASPLTQATALLTMFLKGGSPLLDLCIEQTKNSASEPQFLFFASLLPCSFRS